MIGLRMLAIIISTVIVAGTLEQLKAPAVVIATVAWFGGSVFGWLSRKYVQH